jgi:hypothetical protein
MNDMKMYIMMAGGGIFCLLIMCILMIFKRFKDKIKLKIDAFKKKFFWNGVVRSIFISYMELCITAMVQWLLFKHKSSF